MNIEERRKRLEQYTNDTDSYIENFDNSARFTQHLHCGATSELLESFGNIIRLLFEALGYNEQLCLVRMLLNEMEERKKESRIA